MHILHPPPPFLTIIGLAIHVGYLTSKRICALRSCWTSSRMTWLRSAANTRCFCRTGLTFGSMLSQWVMMLGATPVISRGDQAKTSRNSRRSWIICFLSMGASASPTLTTLRGSSSYNWTSSTEVSDTEDVFSSSLGFANCYACGR